MIVSYCLVIDEKQLVNVEYSNYLCSLVTNDARCTLEMISRIALAHTSTMYKDGSFHQELQVNLKKN